MYPKCHLVIGFLGLLPFLLPGQLPDSTREAAQAANARGASFLLTTQQESGGWGRYPQPAVAALGAMALHECPGADQAAAEAAVQRALTNVLSYVQDTGGIYNADANRGAYPNYNTAICLTAIASLCGDEHPDIIRRARSFLMASQIDDPTSPFHGGFSYGGGNRARADLSNVSWVAEAMHVSAPWVEDKPGTPQAHQKQSQEMWQKLRHFLGNVQKFDPDIELSSQTGTDIGGFAYMPGESVSDLVVTGSMTYAGLKSMIYADLDWRDPRVKAVLNYVNHHYTLAENPGSGQNGYYYYLLMLAKALDSSQLDTLHLADGRTVDWRVDVIDRVVDLQRADGSWRNEDGRFMESMPELVTPYAMLTIRHAMGSAQRQK